MQDPPFYPAGKPLICCQSSVTLKETDETAKFGQLYRHGSAAWATVHEYDRNTSEGMHGYLKDAAHEAIEAPKRRRAFGLAAQQVLVTMLVVSANIRRLASFLEELTKDQRPNTDRKLRRREREALSYYKRFWGDKDKELPFERLI